MAEDEDFYELLGCDETSTVSMCIKYVCTKYPQFYNNRKGLA